jgi:hypothetical protein
MDTDSVHRAEINTCLAAIREHLRHFYEYVQVLKYIWLVMCSRAPCIFKIN